MRYVTLSHTQDKRSGLILDGITTAFARYQANESTASISVPPRFGKSTIIRLMALEVGAITNMPAIVLAPFDDNVCQLLHEGRTRESLQRYGVANAVPFTFHRCTALKLHEWWRLASGTPSLIAATAALMNNTSNQQQFLDGIQDMHSRCGKRILVCIDECQYFKHFQSWGQLVGKIIAAGGFVLLLTGTPVPNVPGFVNIWKEWEDLRCKVYRREIKDGVIHHFVDEYEGQKRELDEVRADFSIPWRAAFQIGALAKINPVFINSDLFDPHGVPVGKLSDLSDKDLAGRLKAIIESPDFVAEMAKVGIDRLLTLRKNAKTANAQMLVVTGHDVHFGVIAPESNRHAEAFVEALEHVVYERGVNLRFATATGVTSDGEPDKKSAARIELFREGKIDVLVVKNMAVVGLDVPPAKVLLYGTTIRQGPMAAQILSRVMTVWERVNASATIIMPQDARMVELYERVVKDQGGAFSESDVELIESTEIDEPDEREDWAAINSRAALFGDEHADMRAGDYEGIIAYFRTRYEAFVEMNDRQIIDLYIAGAIKIDPGQMPSIPPKGAFASGVKNLDADLPKLTGKFGRIAKEIVSKHLDYGSQQALWRDAVMKLQNIAKEICGVTCAVTKVDDAQLLRRLIESLPEAERRLFASA